MDALNGGVYICLIDATTKTKVMFDPKKIGVQTGYSSRPDNEGVWKVQQVVFSGGDEAIFIPAKTHLQIVFNKDVVHIECRQPDSRFKQRIYWIHPTKEGFYRIRLKLDNIKKTSCKFFPKGTPESAATLPVDITGLVFKTVGELIKQLKEDLIKVSITQASPFPKISLRTQVSTPVEKSSIEQIANFNPKQDTTPSTIPRVKNAQDLWSLQFEPRRDELCKRLVSRMVEVFSRIEHPTADEIQEMFAIVDCMDLDQLRSVVKTTARSINPKMIEDLPLLTVITLLFEKLLRIQPKPFAKEQSKTASKDVFEALKPCGLDRLLEQLSEKLSPLNREKSPEPSIIVHLRFLWTVLEIHKNLDADFKKQIPIIDSYHQILARDENHPSLELAYLSSCAKQTFRIKPEGGNRLIPTPEQQSILDIFPPSVFKENTHWHTCLIILLQIRAEETAKSIVGLLKELQRRSERPANSIFCHPFFLKGMLDVLWELLNHPALPPEAGVEAIRIFNQVWLDNSGTNLTPGIFTLPDKSPFSKYAKDLAALAGKLLNNCTLHSNPIFRAAAENFVRLIKSNNPNHLPRFSIAFDSLHFPSSVFSTAKHSEFPAVINPKAVSTSLAILKKYEQLKEEPLYIPLSVTTHEVNQEPSMDEMMLDTILGPHYELIAVEGRPGVGKTLFAKLFISYWYKQILLNVSAPQPIFYINVPEIALPYPPRCNVDDFLKRSKIEFTPEMLSTGCTIFVDGLDELRFSDQGDKVEFLKAFAQVTQKHSRVKFSFFFRTGFISKETVRTLSPKSIFMQLSGFSSEQIYRYMWNYTQKGEAVFGTVKNEWTYEKFAQALDVLLDSRIQENIPKQPSMGTMLGELSNPFLLSIFAQIAPSVVNKIEKEESGKRAPLRGAPLNFKEIVIKLRHKLEFELLSAYVCMSAYREQERSKTRSEAPVIILAKEILEFQTRLAGCIKNRDAQKASHFSSIEYPLTTKDLPYFQALFDQYKSPNDEKIVALLEASLIKENEHRWKFRHEMIAGFFMGLGTFQFDSPQHNLLTRLLDLLDQDTYQLKSRLIIR